MTTLSPEGSRFRIAVGLGCVARQEQVSVQTQLTAQIDGPLRLLCLESAVASSLCLESNRF